MRDVEFAEGEIYHTYNRGVDKRKIFISNDDLERFLEGMGKFNTLEVIGNIGRRHSVSTTDRLVNIVGYCINPNHYHLILEQVSEKGIEKFMHKVGMGYSKYFNTKYKRSGALFQGSFKVKHVETNEYLLHLSAYVNLNHLGHTRGHGVSTLSRTSWDEYINKKFENGICKKEIVLDQFKDREDYKKFAESTLKDIINRKISIEELESDGIELINTR
ncbi:MAG: transposase [Minisyncoccia bacterium]